MHSFKIILLKLKRKQSLLNRTTSVVKIKYKSLYEGESNNKNYIKDKLSSHLSYVIVVPIMLLLTSLCFFEFNLIETIGLDFLHIKSIGYTLALTLLDSRINNIIAITSVSLTVVGFLFTNMSNKSKDSYNMLFTLSYFFSIIYYSLCTSAILILMSTFRNSFNDWQMINISLLSVIFILFEFIFIGFLFSRIIKFSDPDFLYKYSKEKLLSSVKKFIYMEKINQESVIIVESVFEKYGKRAETLYSSKFKNKLFISSHLPASIIIDANISMIERCLINISNNENRDQIEFIPFALNQGIINGFDFNYATLSEKIFQHSTIQNSLSDYIYLSVPKKENLSLYEIHESLYNKTISAIQTNNNDTIKHNLEIYDALYKLYFENFD